MIIDIRDGKVREFYLGQGHPERVKLSWDKDYISKDGRKGMWRLHSLLIGDVWEDKVDVQHLSYRMDYELVNYEE